MESLPITIIQTLIGASIGGILPAFLWLFLWIHIDRDHPEPIRIVLRTFAFGALAVPVIFCIQLGINTLAFGDPSFHSISYVLNFTPFHAFLLLLLWAAAEEIAKYVVAFAAAIHTEHADEAIDVPIYMIAASLGFAALETTFFLITPLLHGDTSAAFLQGLSRSLGATLVHVTCSAIIGLSIGYGYFKLKWARRFYTLIGFILAIILHTTFNFFIIEGQAAAFTALLTTWLIVIGLALTLEKLRLKHVNAIKSSNNYHA